jgi:hypothetical protein
MIEQLFSMFSSSRQGQGALQQLMGQGFSQQQATGMLQAALPVAAQAMTSAQGGMFGGGAQGAAAGQFGQAGQPGQPGIGQALLNIGDSHYAQNFITGAVTGLLRGDGFMGAAVDGMQGVVGGHVAEVIASRFGLPSRVAGAAGAVITPWMIDFLWEKMKGGSAGGGFDFGSMFGGGAPNAGYGGGFGVPSMGGASYGGGLAPPAAGNWVVPGAKGDAGNKASAGYGGYSSGYGVPMGGMFKESKDPKHVK